MMARGLRLAGLLVAVLAPALLAALAVVVAWRVQEANIDRAAFEAFERGGPRSWGGPSWDPMFWAMIAMTSVVLGMSWLLGRAAGRSNRQLLCLLIPGWNVVLLGLVVRDLSGRRPPRAVERRARLSG